MSPTRRTLWLAMAAVAVVSLGALSLSNQGVRFADGSLLTSAHNDKYVAIPVGSLNLSGNATASEGTRVQLAAAGTSAFAANFVVPEDHAPGSEIYVDLYVHNPSANGVCQADIRVSFGRRFRPEQQVDTTSVFGFNEAYPPFLQGDYTLVHEYRFDVGVGGGDALTFGWFRAGDDADDNCGTVEVVGVNVRYQQS
jgi:hypothetical protein